MYFWLPPDFGGARAPPPPPLATPLFQFIIMVFARHVASIMNGIVPTHSRLMRK